MNFLVTGGAGYIGSFVTKRLLDDGYAVLVLDNLKRGHRLAVDQRAEFIEADVGDRELLNNMFGNKKIDCVMHFAGYISVEESTKDPILYFENNTNNAEHLLSAMVYNNVKKIIFSSTAAVYGNPVTTPIPEDHPKNPTNPYGESKLRVEKLLKKFNSESGIDFVSLRYFNACGAALDGSLGENHNPETHIVPRAIEAALNNSEFFLYGVDYVTPDGSCIRDYIHVSDLAHAHVLAVKKLQNEKGGFFYNVGTGRGYSNKEVIEMVKKVSGVDFKVTVSSRRTGDPDILIADHTKIKKELGFSPNFSDLETIVKTAWEWHKKLKIKN